MSIISISGKAGSGKDTAGLIFQELLNNQYEIKKWAGPLRTVAAILLGIDEAFLYTDEFKKMVLPECWSIAYCYHCNWTGTKDELEFTDAELATYNQDTYSCPKCGESEVTSNLMTGREFLQKLGTDAIRDGLHKEAWVNATMSQYKAYQKCSVWEDEHPNEMAPYSHKYCASCQKQFSGYKLQPYCGICAKTDTYPSWILTDTRFENELAAVKAVGGISIRIRRDQCGIITPNHESEIALDSAKFDYEISNDGTIEELTQKLKDVLEQIQSIPQLNQPV